MFIIKITDFIEIIVFLLILFIVLIFRNLKKIYRKNKKSTPNRELAIKIIDEFENLLSIYNIKLPSEDRENDETEACIFGKNYYELEDTITEILDNSIQKLKGV